MVTYIKECIKLGSVRKKLLVTIGLLLAYTSTVLAQLGRNGEGIIPGEQNNFVFEWFASAGGFLANSLMIPQSGSPQAFMIWFAGFGLTIFGFFKAVSNFNDKVDWLDGNKEEALVGVLLALIFIGGANFMGFLTGVWMLLWVGVILTLIGVSLYGGVWFTSKGRNLLGMMGSGVLSTSHSLRTGGIGSYASGAAGAVTSYFGSPVEDVWDNYKDLPRCDANVHINPQDPPAGGGGGPYDCWVSGCGGDWNP